MNLTLESLKEALHIKETIASLEARLLKLFPDGGGEIPFPFTILKPGKKRRRKMSAAARARIGAAQKARWAKQKGESTAPATKPSTKKRKLSAEGRARIIAGQKKRWANR